MHSLITATAGNASLTMSSREIAELTGKRHDNVISDIEKMLKDVGEDALKFEGIYLDTYRREKKCYNLPQDLTYTLVAGYRSDLRLRIVRRWMELEAKPSIAAPSNMVEALTLALEQQKALEAKDEELKAANNMVILKEALLSATQPKAEALDRISIASGEYGLTEAAKILQIKPGKFFDWLDANRCRYSKGKNKLAYQDKIDAGYFRNRATSYTDSNGEHQAGNTIRVTPKGLTWLARVVPGASLDPDISPAPVPGDAPAPFVKTPAHTA